MGAIEINFDLISQIERDLGPGKRSGRWVIFRCPFHDDKHPSLGVTNGDQQRGPYFKCFAASCGVYGGPIKWLMEYHRMTYPDALGVYRGESYAISTRPRALANLDWIPDYPPGEQWQKRAWELIERAERNLWDGPGAMDMINWPVVDPITGDTLLQACTAQSWLFSRGLTEETLRKWRIGYIPVRKYEKAGDWGLDGDQVIIPRGILIPGIMGSDIWYLKVRRPLPKPYKYIQVRDSKPALYLVDTLPGKDAVIFCEGELDALLLWQEVNEIAGVVTLGSANESLSIATWGLHLLHTTRRFVAYDADHSGQVGMDKLAWMNPEILSIPIVRPADKDLTDYYMSGGSLRAWVEEALVGEPE